MIDQDLNNTDQREIKTWQLKKIKHVGTISYGIGEPPEYKDSGTPLIRATNISEGKISLKGAVFVMPSDIPSKKIFWLKEGDIIVVRSGAYTGDSGLVRKNIAGAIAGFDMIIRAKKVRPEYLQYCLLSPELKEAQIDLETARAAQPHLNAEELGGCSFLCPPMAEQDTIVKFLDNETAKIDTLIAEQERLIELLQEKRQAVISHAVTKGLSSNAPMKDSGVEWLGKVPEHWSVTRLGYHTKAKGGSGFPDEYQGYIDAEIPFLKVANLGKKECLATTDGFEHTISKDTARILRAEVYKKGSVVFAKVGAALLLGRYKLLAQDSCIDNNMMTLLNDEQTVLNNFLRLSLTTIKLEMIVNPGAIPSINASQVHDLKLAFPPISEQAEICRAVENKVNKLDELAQKSQKAVELLRERRSAVISNAVTGKIDLRALALEEAAA